MKNFPIALLVLLTACHRSTPPTPPTLPVAQAHSDPSPQTDQQQTRPKVVAGREPSFFDLGTDDRSYGDATKGQLDRIDALLASTGFLTTTEGLKSFFADSAGRLPDVRRLANDAGRAADPRIYLEMAVWATRRARDNGPVLYQMLLKNADRYVGRPWFIMNTKILELHEDGQFSVGRIEMDPGANPLFIAARFTTPFIEGDRVDVIGYFGGVETYETKVHESRGIPSFAAAGIFKPGTIVAINRIVKAWLADPTPNQLRAQARKF